MKLRHRIVSGAAAFACAVTSVAQTTAPAADVPTPQIGQLGKDSVWVPTPDRLIVRMLQIADTTERDLVVDLGSGDGRIPIVAARRFGARALGVELDGDLVRYSIRAAERAGVADRAKFVQQDLFETDLAQATVIALYISPHVMLKLKPKLLALAPGTRVVSHQFTLGDWEPDEQVKVEGRTAHLWVVPANVAGDWTLRLGEDAYDLRFEQTYQILRGGAQFNGRPRPVIGARVRGSAVRFTLIDRNGDSRTLEGTVTEGGMRGEVYALEGKIVTTWRADRR